MERCSCVVRICILAIFKVSWNCGVLSRPFAFAASDMAMNLGSAAASWCFNCGVTVGASALAIFSKSLRVNTVLQSAGFLAGTPFPAAVLEAVAAFEAGGHIPTIVSTTASSGTSAAGAGAGAPPFGACAAPGGAGDGVGCICPHAIVPNNTHSSQLLRIHKILQDWSIRKLEPLELSIVAYERFLFPQANRPRQFDCVGATRRYRR